ncbi:hypothetical protein DRQ33_08035 [bacterium]|nr:MAG: hypothetical protein DRQ33_08035 [bacterium]
MGYTPSAGEAIADGAPEICIDIEDTMSGIDDATIAIIVNGVEYDLDSLGFTWNGSQMCFYPESLGIWWNGGDIIEVCASAFDLNCDCPNELDSCWSFLIASGGPVASFARPEPDIVSACVEESVVIMLYDPQEDNIVDTTITLSVSRNGGIPEVLIQGGTSQLRWFENDSILILNPSPPFANGDTLDVCITVAEDTLGNELEDSVCVRFAMDLSAYEAFGHQPSNLDSVNTRTPDISIIAVDSITGIVDSSVIFIVDGNEYTLDSSSLWWGNDSTLVFSPESAGVYWNGGYCVVCSLYAHDQPTVGYCEPNDSTVWWMFYIASGGPSADIARPLENTFSSCVDEHIIMIIQDTDGVDPTSIILQVEGISYTVDSTQLGFSNDSLYFYPTIPFANEDTINVILAAANDVLGNPIDATIDWSFIMDMTAPWTTLDEPMGEMVRDREQDIAITIGDELAGVDAASVRIWVNEIEYDGTNFIWTENTGIRGGTVLFVPENVGVKFPPGDSVCVVISATDEVDYCADNEYDTTYCFMIEPEVACLAHPNPFTPNGDAINRFAVFDYPYMLSEGATLKIYNLRNVLVYEEKLEKVENIRQFDDRNWDGKDNDGKPLATGLYIWMIIRNGEVVCNGTIVIAR